MKKFFVLLKKEIRELLTPQMLIPLVVIIVMFMFIGKVVGKQAEKTAAVQPVLVVDMDKTEQSQKLIAGFSAVGLKPELAGTVSDTEALAQAKRQNIKAVAVIPEGYGNAVLGNAPVSVKLYSLMNNFSLVGSRSSQGAAAALARVNEQLSVEYLQKAASGKDPQVLKQPLTINNWVVIGQRQAEVNPAAVSGIISSQTTFIPIILFLVITFSAQLVALSLATEKENKTLETLLTSPVGRKTIVAAKLVAAGLVALLSAAAYLFGMSYYFKGMTGLGGAQAADPATIMAVKSLGLTFGVGDYAMLGLSLFFGILVALAIALLLGSFAEDAKSVQGLVTPLMVLVMVPYFFTLLLDMGALSATVRYFIYAIPFTHPFMAAPNLLLHNYSSVGFGILYMAIVFIFFVIIASRIFASEKILTMKLNFRRKSE